MGPKARIDHLVEDATAGLRADPELWLDVRQELANHIEDAVQAHRAEGKSEAESVELAARSFGSPLDVAAELASANRGRMRLRALARLAARALLVPAAVAVAFLVCSRILPLRDAFALLNGLTTGFSGPPFSEGDAVAALARGLPPDKALILRGDPSRPKKAEQQRAIWEADPDSKVYYANYITTLLGDYNASESGWTPDLALRNLVQQELRRGEALDPDNARYGVLLVTVWMRQAAEIKYEDRENGPCAERFVLKDRALLDRAAAQLVAAARKPYYKTYAQEMLRERLALLPPAHHLEDQIVRIALAACVPLPDCAMMRETIRIAGHYGELLVAEGKASQAEPILDVWYPLAVKMDADAFTLIELLVGASIVKIGEQHAVPAYEKAGMVGKAAWTRARAERLDEPVDAYMKGRESMASQAFGEDLRRSGSIFDNLLMPALDAEVLKQYDLAPGRRLEQVLAEQVAASAYLVLFVAMMGLAALIALRWRWAKGMASAPLLLLPDWRAMVKILALAILLPLAAYYAYTRWSGLAGREFGLRYIGYRFALEILILGLTILGLAVSMAGPRIRRRCESLGIPVPAPMALRYRVAFWALIVVLWTACLTFRTGRPWIPEWLLALAVAALPSVLAMGRFGALRVVRFLGLAGAIGAVVAIALAFPTFILAVPTWLAAVALASLGVVCVWGLIGLVRAIARPTEYGLYRGTVAWSLIPVFAAAILVVAAATHPYLANREAALVGADDTLTSTSRQLSFTRAESLMVERLKAGVLEAAREAEAKP